MRNASDGLIIEKIRLMSLSILEERIEKDLMNHFRYKILPEAKKQIVGKLSAEIYEDNMSFTININFGGNEDECN